MDGHQAVGGFVVSREQFFKFSIILLTSFLFFSALPTPKTAPRRRTPPQRRMVPTLKMAPKLTDGSSSRTGCASCRWPSRC